MCGVRVNIMFLGNMKTCDEPLRALAKLPEFSPIYGAVVRKLDAPSRIAKSFSFVYRR